MPDGWREKSFSKCLISKKVRAIQNNAEKRISVNLSNTETTARWWGAHHTFHNHSCLLSSGSLKFHHSHNLIRISQILLIGWFYTCVKAAVYSSQTAHGLQQAASRLKLSAVSPCLAKAGRGCFLSCCLSCRLETIIFVRKCRVSPFLGAHLGLGTVLVCCSFILQHLLLKTKLKRD